MSIEENILNQSAETNKKLEAMQALSSISVDKLEKIASKIKAPDNSEVSGLLKELIKNTNEPVQLNVKLDIK